MSTFHTSFMAGLSLPSVPAAALVFCLNISAIIPICTSKSAYERRDTRGKSSRGGQNSQAKRGRQANNAVESGTINPHNLILEYQLKILQV